MNKIGNIIFEDELVNHTESEYINYIKEPVDIESVDYRLPTLYVGWNFLKRVNPDNELIQKHSILDKRIYSNILYWEYSFKENKSQHVSGVEMFVNNVPQYYFGSKYRYSNIDPVFFNISSVSDLMDLLPKQINYYYEYKDEMIYLLSDDNITGIDLKMYGFFDFDIEEIKTTIKKRCTSGETDKEGLIYQKYYKILPHYEYLKRYLVVILSKH